MCESVCVLKSVWESVVMQSSAVYWVSEICVWAKECGLAIQCFLLYAPAVIEAQVLIQSCEIGSLVVYVQKQSQTVWGQFYFHGGSHNVFYPKTNKHKGKTEAVNSQSEPD